VRQVSETFILRRRLASGASCALNLTNPGGVTLLSGQEAAALEAMLDASGRVVAVPSYTDPPPTHSAARRLGITRTRGVQVALSRRVPRMLAVWVHTSNGCNLSCSYCYIPQLRKALIPEQAVRHLMSEQVSSVMVSGLIKVCQREGFECLLLRFAGGEPTLNWPEVVRTCQEAVRSCNDAGIEPVFHMITNGVFDPAKVIPDAVALKMRISISVDGDPDAHDAVRFLTSRVAQASYGDGEPTDAARPRRRGSWAIVRANIDNLLAAGIQPFLLCTVDERNYRQLNELIEYCAATKLGFRLSPVRDARTCKLPGLQEAMTSELIGLYRRMGESHPLDMPIGSFARFAEWDLHKRKRQACGSCHSMLAVGESGQVASCQMRLDHPIATLQDGAFDQVFDILRRSADYEYFVHPEEKTGKCAGCVFKHTCAGGCPEHTRLVFGSNNHASPWCDLYTAMMPEYVAAIGRQLERVQNAQGGEATAESAARSASLSPQWHSDPSGRHEYRYWNGASWTDFVADNGQTGTDPLMDENLSARSGSSRESG
jgi:uncharacterized protein